MGGRQSSLFQPLQASPVSRNTHSCVLPDARRRRLLELLRYLTNNLTLGFSREVTFVPDGPCTRFAAADEPRLMFYSAEFNLLFNCTFKNINADRISSRK